MHIFAHGGDFSWPRVLVLIGAVLLRSADFVAGAAHGGDRRGAQIS